MALLCHHPGDMNCNYNSRLTTNHLVSDGPSRLLDSTFLLQDSASSYYNEMSGGHSSGLYSGQSSLNGQNHLQSLGNSCSLPQVPLDLQCGSE